MKSKDKVTLMVCTAASGAKLPLFMVGKSKTPECLGTCDLMGSHQCPIQINLMHGLIRKLQFIG